MGSELIDAATGRQLWGLADPRWYAELWTTGGPLRALRLTEDERGGRYGRIRATRLLKFPAFAPLMRGFEPYTKLMRAIQSVVLDNSAVTTFPYDWRLPISHNSSILAEKAHRHLMAWRKHPTQRAARRVDVDDREAGLVIVAHSMGGLLARHLALIPGALNDIRATITLGTPFYGAVKSAEILSSGRGAALPMPRSRLRDVAVTLPAIHALLPSYRCVDEGNVARRLVAADVMAFGGDADLAQAAFDWHSSVADVALPGHAQIVGTYQPTLQSMTLRDGIVMGKEYTCKEKAVGGIERLDLAGDGTVYRESAELPGSMALPLAQSHGALAQSGEAVLAVLDILTCHDRGPWLGAGEVGVAVPDVVEPCRPFEIMLRGVEHPRAANCRIIDVATNRIVAVPVVEMRDGHFVADVALPTPGIFRVRVVSGGESGPSQLVLAAGMPDE